MLLLDLSCYSAMFYCGLVKEMGNRNVFQIILYRIQQLQLFGTNQTECSIERVVISKLILRNSLHYLVLWSRRPTTDGLTNGRCEIADMVPDHAFWDPIPLAKGPLIQVGSMVLKWK